MGELLGLGGKSNVSSDLIRFNALALEVNMSNHITNRQLHRSGPILLTMDLDVQSVFSTD